MVLYTLKENSTVDLLERLRNSKNINKNYNCTGKPYQGKKSTAYLQQCMYTTEA